MNEQVEIEGTVVAVLQEPAQRAWLSHFTRALLDERLANGNCRPLRPVEKFFDCLGLSGHRKCLGHVDKDANSHREGNGLTSFEPRTTYHLSGYYVMPCEAPWED